MTLEKELKKYLLTLNFKSLDLTSKIKNIQLKKIGIGESNLNYLAKLNGEKFIIRINMDSKKPNKSKEEFFALKKIENLKIAPKALLLNDSRNVIDETFIILKYLPGSTLSKSKKKLDSKTIIKLAILVAKLHLTKINKINLEMEKSTYNSLLLSTKENIEYIKKKRAHYFNNDQFIKLINTSFNKFQRSLDLSKYPTKFCIIHGDIQEQNILIYKDKLSLIDWESVGLGDPAAEIGIIFEAFGRLKFSYKQRQLFLKNYLKIRPDNTLRQRIKILIPIIEYSQFIWAIMHVFEIGENEMNKLFVKNKNLKEDINFAKETFNLCKSSNIFYKNLKWSPNTIFPKNYLNK